MLNLFPYSYIFSVVLNSISPECQELKVQYDTCFNRWFINDKFLKGQTDDKSCAELNLSVRSGVCWFCCEIFFLRE